MSKMRVYEYAKQKNMTSREVIDLLKELDVDVSNHMATITTNVIKQLDEKVSGSNKKETGSEQKKTDTSKTKPQNQKKKHKPNKNQKKKNKQMNKRKHQD